MAQKPIAIAAEVRTKWRRLMPNLRRQRSVSRSARCMIASCSLVGGGGKYSSFEHGGPVALVARARELPVEPLPRRADLGRSDAELGGVEVDVPARARPPVGE